MISKLASDAAIDPDKTYNLPGYSQLLGHFIRKLGLENILLVGHSLGGHIAIEVADLVPNVIGLVIFGTPPIGLPPAMEEMFLPNPAIAFACKGELTSEEADQLAASFTKGSNNMASQILNTDTNFRTAFGASVGEGKFKNELEICQNLIIPLAILHGEEDALVNLQYLEGLSLPSLWGRVRFMYLREVGIRHMWSQRMNLIWYYYATLSNYSKPVIYG